MSSDFPALTAEDWHAKVAADLGTGDIDRVLAYDDLDGLGLHVLEHESTAPTAGDPAGFPGLPPFTRGVRPPGVERAWIVGQVIEDGELEAAHRSLHHDLRLGTGALWLRLDAGIVRARPDGIPIDSAADFESLLAGVDGGIVELILDAGPRPLLAAGLIADWCRRRGSSPAELSGCLAIDPLGHLARDGALPGSLDAAFEDLAGIARWCSEKAPRFRAGIVSSLPYHEAGATPVQELAFALAGGVETLRQLEGFGVEAEAAADQLLACHAVGRDLFLEIAKLRAWRLLWSKVLKASGAAPAAGRQRMAILPARTNLTRIDPWVNLLRASAQTFVGACVQADIIITPRFDTLSSGGDELSRRTAINLQHVLAQEAHLGRVADPAGGSWAIEQMTDRLARAAWREFQQIEAKGGFSKALLGGDVQQAVAEKAATRRRQVATRRQAVVGVSVFPHAGEKLPARAAAEEGCNGRPSPGDRGIDPSVPAVTAAFEAGVLVADVAARLRRGEATRATRLEPFRAASGFEAVRMAVEQVARAGDRPAVFLAGLGEPSESRARLEFSSGLFSIAGLELCSAEGLAAGGWSEDAAAELARGLRDSGARAAVLCSSDQRYPEVVGSAATALRQAGVTRLFVAGKPGDHEAAWRAAGVDDFIFLGCDVQAILERLVRDLGVPPWQ